MRTNPTYVCVTNYVIVLIFFIDITFSFHNLSSNGVQLANCTDFISLKCIQLNMGQYYCDDPEIDPETQQAAGCSEHKRSVKVNCYPVANICCDGFLHTGQSVGFTVDAPCKWTNGKKFTTSILLSIFLGWLGVDRFYLGYPALGLLKLSTFGFMFIWTLIDMILIALQVVGPADGSDYVVDYYGPRLEHITIDNDTFMIKT